MGNLLRVPRKDVLPSVKGTLNHSFSNYIGLRIAREGISAARVHEIACNLPRSSDPSWEELADVPDNLNYSRSHAGELPDPGLMIEDLREESATSRWKLQPLPHRLWRVSNQTCQTGLVKKPLSGKIIHCLNNEYGIWYWFRRVT